MKKFRESELDSVNTNEIMSDYHFYFQMICEERELDFESAK
mgnify:FL=1